MTKSEVRKVGAPKRCKCGQMVRTVPLTSGSTAIVEAEPKRMVVLGAQATLYGDPAIVGSVRYAYVPHECAGP